MALPPWRALGRAETHRLVALVWPAAEQITRGLGLRAFAGLEGRS
jgi:hypothetical protein